MNASPGPSYSVQVLFSGVGAHGIGDPSLAQAPNSSRLWMTYSAVDPSPTWPTVNQNVESTRLAYSDNGGTFWTETGTVVNAITEHTPPLSAPDNDGTWFSETSQLVYDPGAAAGQHYKLLWHHYLVTGGTAQFGDGWLDMKMADSPGDLATAFEIKLFAGSASDRRACAFQ